MSDDRAGTGRESGQSPGSQARRAFHESVFAEKVAPNTQRRGQGSRGAKNRARCQSVQADRPREDQVRPAEVHHPRRDDRQEGQRPRLDPACRRSTSPSSATGPRTAAASARGPATSARRSAAPATASRARRAGEAPGEHILEVELTLDELAADPRRGAGAAAHRAQGQGEHHRGEGQVHRHPPGRPRDPAPLQAHLQEGAEAADRLEHVRPATTRWSSRSARTSSTARGTRSRCRSPTPWSST